MPSSSAAHRQHGRINLAEIKGRISKRLGPDRSNRYFTCLNQFLSKKITKQEFNKQCLSLFGHDNIQLHNNFIRSILKNSLLSKTPPLQNSQNYLDKTPVKSLGTNLPPSRCNGMRSPRKVRTGSGERRVRDSGYGEPNGLVGFDVNPNSVLVDGSITENGLLHHKEEFEDQNETLCSKREQIKAPLGIPFCRASAGGSRLPSYGGFSSSASTGVPSCSSLGELFNIDSIRNRVESIAKREGLEAVGTNCAELLQKSLDVYLTRLISSVANLSGSVKRSNIDQKTIKLEDFALAVQLSPRQFGENAPELIEKMNMRLFEKRDEYDKRRYESKRKDFL
jgi:histone H3/H4